MKKILLASLLIIFALPKFSNGMHKKVKKNSTKTVSPKSLEGRWIVTYIEGKEASIIYKDKIPELIFDLKNGKLSGNNGCNSIFGPVKVEGSKIIFPHPLGSTLMACEGNGEELFMGGLVKMTSFSFHGNNEIDLISGDIGIMRLQRK